MVVLLICIRDFDYVIRCGPYPQVPVRFKKKKKSGKESQFKVSYPELGSDPPIGSNRDMGGDTHGLWSHYQLEKLSLVVIGYSKINSMSMGPLTTTKLAWLQKDTINMRGLTSLKFSC